jgi:hypothetical protein
MSTQATKPATGVDNQIILYAKHWYGRSDNIINDLKEVICKCCWLDSVSDRDVMELLSRTFSVYCTEHDRSEGLFEMLGWKWKGFSENLQRTPEQVMIGKLSIVKGEYVNKAEMMDDFKVADLDKEPVTMEQVEEILAD